MRLPACVGASLGCVALSVRLRDVPQAPRRVAVRASQPGRRLVAWRRPGRWRRDPTAENGSRPYSPRVARSIARSTPPRTRWPMSLRPWNIAWRRLGGGPDGTYVLQANLQPEPWVGHKPLEQAVCRDPQ